MRTMLVVGATGVVGEAALAHFAASPAWNAVGLSRRTPDPLADSPFRHISVDLTDGDACRHASEQLTDVTHVVYAAVSESPALVDGWHDRDRMSTNLMMLRNILEPLVEAAPGLQHLSVLQGAKAYGAHAGHRPRLPARESDPRVEHDNFYFLQEDYVRDVGQRRGLPWTIFRPQVVIGGAWGAAMNPLLPVAVYAAIRREEGKPFSYPGGEVQIAELVDAALLAEAFEWAATTPAATNETFNITNGDVFAWRDAWSLLGHELGVDPGSDEPMHLAEYLVERDVTWQRIVERQGLRRLSLADLLGQSHHYADILLRAGTTTIGYPTLLSTVKLRQAGFTACRDSTTTLRDWTRAMRERRLIPNKF